jgi:hypothetical protein
MEWVSPGVQLRLEGCQQSPFQLVDIGLGMSLRRIQFYSFHFFFVPLFLRALYTLFAYR